MSIQPSDWPEELIEILVGDIELANRKDPRSWSIYTYQESPVFGVGMMTVLMLRKDHKVTFLVSLATLGLEQRELIQQASGTEIQSDEYFHARIELPFLLENLDWLLPAHHAGINRQATHLSARWKWHRQDMLEQFAQMRGGDLPSPAYQKQPPPPIESCPPLISAHFRMNGLTYSDRQIADFYTALQTKGFVVLSGISGTGKSKIAQHFTDLLPDGLVAGTEVSTQENSVSLTLNPYSKQYNRIIIPSRFSGLFPLLDVGDTIRIPFVHDGSQFEGRLVNQRNGGLTLFWKKDFSDVIKNQETGEKLSLTPVYASDQETLERIDFTFSSESTTTTTKTIDSTLFLSVRPDWRDSTSLLGYYNPLLEAYEWTDFLRFILNAAENYRSDNPAAWFVILDEMNLAHVEYYFADMLSVLESGRDDSGFSRESLRLTFPDDLASEIPPHEIHLPPNLYIIGTVNMDETTHAFSPKVLDRAFTMELTDVDFTNYPTTLEASTDELTEAQKEAFLTQFSQQGLYPGIRKHEIAAYVAQNPRIRELLQSLNTMLAQHRFHFGYRVFDEIVQFLSNAEENGMYDDWWSALDSAAYMKILPKFSGSEVRVGKPLEILVAWANDPFGDGIDTPLLPRLHQRAVQMQEQLQIDGFVTAF